MNVEILKKQKQPEGDRNSLNGDAGKKEQLTQQHKTSFDFKGFEPQQNVLIFQYPNLIFIRLPINF